MIPRPLSIADLNVWKADTEAETEAPSEGSETGYGDELYSEPDCTPLGWRPSQTPRSTGTVCVGETRLEYLMHAPSILPLSPEDNPWLAAVSKHRESLKAIFLDYDGTLREFNSKPDEAVPTPELHNLLAALNAREDLLVHIISGRDAEFLRAHLGGYERFVLIAEHERRVAGRFQLWRPDTETGWHAEAAVTGQYWRVLARCEINTMCGKVRDSHLEEKASSLVWHFRGAMDDATAEAAADKLAHRLEKIRQSPRSGHIKVSRGSKTVEVSSRNVSKGDMVKRICETRSQLGRPFAAVLVAGDDVSDESMFDPSVSDNFLSIKVGFQHTCAKYYVEEPKNLRAFLWTILSSNS